jgi:flagellar hook-associated protein 2
MADPVASFQGLATGINFRDMVDQIVVSESGPQRRLESRILDLQRRQGAMDQVRDLVSRIDDAATALGEGTAFDGFNTSLLGLTSTEIPPFSVTTTGEASAGTQDVKVLQLAAAERMGGTTFSSKTTALGFSGEFIIGGQVVTISASDSLTQVVDSINAKNTGTSASRVSASILSTGTTENRLILGSDDTGTAGIDMVDGSTGVLRSLGLIETGTEIKSGTTDGAKSDGFISSTTAVGSLLGLTTLPASGAVTIGGLSVTIDLSVDSLAAIASAINTEAGLQSSAISAQVVQEVDADKNTVNRLDISGTTAFTDTNRILESLGVLRGTRGAETQVIQSGNSFTDGDAVTVATASTTLSNVYLAGSSAGVLANDTLSFTGTRGDGTTFTKTYTVGGADTLQNVLDSLNAVDAFGGGGQTATASVSGGRLVVTDGTSGESRLGLQVTSNNEGGGTLDFGTTTVSAKGRDRVLVSGANAQVEINGAFVEDSDNSITDVLAGITLELTAVRATPVTVNIVRDVDSAARDITAFVNAVNGFEDFAAIQFSGLGAAEGEVIPSLSGSVLLRQIRTQVRDTMNSTLSGNASGAFRRLADVGIEIGQDGRYTVDDVKVKDALSTNFKDVEGMFSALGTPDNTNIEFVASTVKTQAGTYELVVTTAASKGTTTGSGFGATYVDDGTADTMTIRDLGSNSDYSVSLNNGDTLTQIVDRLNTEFASAAIHKLEASNTLYSDAIGTTATESTTLDSLFSSGGTNYGVAQDDVITLSGTGSDGSAIFREIVVGDPATQTLGDIKAEIELELNADVNLTVANGVLTFTAKEADVNPLAVTLASDNAGGGTLTFGTMDVTTVGRGTAGITASASGGELKLAHDTFGSAEGFQISYTAGGTDGSGSLGVTAATYAGADIAGTLGGLAATGTGALLSGDVDTAVEGLAVRYSAAGTGSVGNLTFSRGIASLMEVMADPLLSTESGSIDDLVNGLDDQILSIKDRVSQLDDRMEERRARLIARFSSLEQAMAQANAQAQWFQAQLSSLGGGAGG